METDLNGHFEVLSEAVQNILRVHGVKSSYQKAKDFFRGTKVTQELYQKFIEGLPINLDKKQFG